MACDHNIVEGRKPGTERCTKCSYRYPCREESCGHLDCIDTRGVPPKCHFCQKRVEGVRGETWTAWMVWGHTRAVHYTCRDARATPVERIRWGINFNL